MKNKLELVADMSIVVDIIFTAIAVIYGNMGNKNLSNLFFGISGFAVTFAFVCIIIKWFVRSKEK